MHLEENKTKDKALDTLTNQSFSFDTYSAYLRVIRKKRRISMALLFLPVLINILLAKILVRGDRSMNLNLQTELLSNQHHINS